MGIRDMSHSVSRFLAVMFTVCFFTIPFVSAADLTYTYDANGNLINGDGFSYIYDDANHLTEVRHASDNTLIAQYYYDDAGNRIKKVVNGVTTYYIGNYLESRVSGAQENDTSYYFANNERVARKDPDGSKYYYHGDHLGSTSIVTNASGAVVESVAYLPYGETQSKTGCGSTYLYTDQELDSESGLYYYGARYYSPEIMRFAEPDMIIQNMYNPQNLNKYSYVLNNPLKYTDPSGFGVDLATEHISDSAKNVIFSWASPMGLAEKFIPGLGIIDTVRDVTNPIIDALLLPAAAIIDESNPQDVRTFEMTHDIAHMSTNPMFWATLGAGLVSKPALGKNVGYKEIVVSAMISGEALDIAEEELQMSFTPLYYLAKNDPLAPISSMRTRGEESKNKWINYFYGDENNQPTQTIPQEQPENQYCSAFPEKPIFPSRGA